MGMGICPRSVHFGSLGLVWMFVPLFPWSIASGYFPNTALHRASLAHPANESITSICWLGHPPPL